VSPWWSQPIADENVSEEDLDDLELELEDDDSEDEEEQAAAPARSSSRGGGGSGSGSGRRRNRRRTGAPADAPEKAPEASDDEPSGGGRPAPPRRGGRDRSERSGRNEKTERSSRPAKKPTPAPAPEPPTFDVSPIEIEQAREVIMGPERKESVNDERKIAVFCDLENLALGVRDSKEVNKFDINLVLERLLEKGKIIVKKAYCDWERYSEYKRPFHEAAIELIDIPQKHYSGKNSADIKMVVDAMDMSYAKEHLDTFVMLSGDSDFSPLVSKLKENNKYVIGVGVKGSSSNLLIDNCDEFIYYEDIWRDMQQGPALEGSLSKKQSEVFALAVDAIQALARENKDVLWGSMVKQTMQRKKPSFNESYYGYSSFSDLLEDAEEQGLLKIKKDQRSGSYIVTGFAGQAKRRRGRG
jgi:uncharacterized protein (TIGR00288 family)